MFKQRLKTRTGALVLTAAALTAPIGAVAATTATAGTANAAVYVKVHAAPSAGAKVVGHTYADCRTIGHAPSRKGNGGVWYRIGKGWIFNSARTPFCH